MGAKLEIAIGVYDDPDNRKQAECKVDLHRENLAVFGGAMSGKSMLMKTLLVQLHDAVRQSPSSVRQAVCLLDFGGNLRDYGQLPLVEGYFSAGSEENVRRVFRHMQERLEKNTRGLKENSFQDKPDAEDVIHTVFIVDGLSSMVAEERFAPYTDVLHKLAREGLSKGVSVVITANAPSGGVGRMLTCFERIVAFELKKEQYSDLFPHRVEQPLAIKGRGIAGVDRAAYEFQAYLPYTQKGQENQTTAEQDEKLLEEIQRDWKKETQIVRPKKIRTFQDELTDKNWSEYRPGEDDPDDVLDMEFPFTPGMNHYTMEPVSLDLSKIGALAIYGRKRFGKTNLLKRLVESVQKNAAKKNMTPRFLCLTDAGEKMEDWNWRDGTEREFYAQSKQLLEELEQNYGIRVAGNGLARCDESEERKRIGEPDPNWFTVLVLQSRRFYREGVDMRYNEHQLLDRVLDAISDRDLSNFLVVLADVASLPTSRGREAVNSMVTHAFLLDDVLRFVRDKGRRSVFGQLDQDELKDAFGLCDLGDGFYFELDGEEQIQKVRFLKAKEPATGAEVEQLEEQPAEQIMEQEAVIP